MVSLPLISKLGELGIYGEKPHATTNLFKIFTNTDFHSNNRVNKTRMSVVMVTKYKVLIYITILFKHTSVTVTKAQLTLL